jgi:ribosomal protein L11 methyltransferase
MQVLEIECSAREKDRIVAELWEAGTVGVIDEDAPGGRSLLKAFFEQRPAGLAKLGGRWGRERPEDWVKVSQSQWEALTVGNRFFLAPSWCGDPTPPGRIRLEMRPGLACGTGWHPATRLALQAMERSLRPGAAVLDVGTGSGILSVAAARLDAGRVVACDIDPAAIAVAAERFRDERIQAALFVGSARSVRSDSFDLVVANINAETLSALAPDILRVRTTGGRAVLSGFARRHVNRIHEAFGCGTLFEDGDWASLVC